MNKKYSDLLMSATHMLTHRINNCIDLIASNSIISDAIRQFVNHPAYINNIYSEGYVNNRFYTGCEIIDKFESRLIELVNKIFKYKYVNVQAPSGSIANQIIYTSLLQSKDYILSMRLVDGGHLTHSRINHTSSIFNFIHYRLTENGRIDYEHIKRQAIEYKPKIIIAGYSCYPFDIDHKTIRDICDEISAIYVFDMCHISDLIAGNVMAHAYAYADIAITTTHKGIRGAKGAIIMTNNKDIMDNINKYTFPKTCGGQNTTSLICNTMAFEDMAHISFRVMARQIVHNSRLFIKYLINNNVKLLYDHSDNHIVIIDLYEYKDKEIAFKVTKALERIHIYCNINATYRDNSFASASGIRLGTKIITYRNISENNIELLAYIIANVIQDVNNNTYDSKYDQYKRYAMSIIDSMTTMM